VISDLIANKYSQIVELYQGIIRDAENNEPGCFEFQLFTEVDPLSGIEELFTIERYVSFTVPTSDATGGSEAPELHLHI
jgi:hypothetical protein